LELEPEEITDAVTRIKEELDPAPGKRLFTDAAPTVLPDVTLTQNPDGQWKAAANRNIFPVLEVSTAYREYLESGSASQEDKKYIRGKQGEAQNLIDAIDYRLLTIEKIALALTVLQPEFFDGGKKEDLRPLTQNALAASLNFAESTVSRAMQDKYVATPWGTLPFRIFFPSAIRSGDGETVSSSKIRRRIREMIAAEDKRHPISDDDISKRLADEGFNVKRRTVAKYRDLEKIPATSARRQR
jgi:RNA polymerase sigma-54 factor